MNLLSSALLYKCREYVKFKCSHLLSQMFKVKQSNCQGFSSKKHFKMPTCLP